MPSVRPVGSGFPRAARLLLPAQFKACFETRLRVASRLFRAHLAPSDEPRLGLAVSRKVSPRAVDRNRIKRCARTEFRLARASMPAYDLVLLARPEARAATPDELRSDLALLWRRVAALKRPEPRGTMRADPAGADCGAPDSPPSAPAPTDASEPGAFRSTPE